MITIVTSRYGGAYSGGAWLAFNCWFEDVPRAAFGDDCVCAEFFGSAAAASVGRGATPDEAMADMRTRELEL